VHSEYPKGRGEEVTSFPGAENHSGVNGKTGTIGGGGDGKETDREAQQA